MMAQNDLVVVGIDVAKDKVDACIRSLSQRADVPEHRAGAAQADRLACASTRSTKAVMEASGGYERDWAKALREAGIEVRIVDPKRVRNFARSAGRLAKNDAIDAEMIAWFAETFGEAKGQAYDAAREKLVADRECASGLCSTCRPACKTGASMPAPEVVQKMQARLSKKIALELARLEAAIAAMIKATRAFCRARRDHRERAGTWRDHLRRPDRGDAGTGPGEQQGRRRLARRRSLR